MNDGTGDSDRSTADIEAAVESVLDSQGVTTPVAGATLEAGELVVDLSPQAGAGPSAARVEAALRDALPRVHTVRVNRGTPGAGIWLLVDVFRLAG